MPDIQKTKYYQEGRNTKHISDPKEIYNLQLQYWDEIEECLKIDKSFQLFKREKAVFYKTQHPDFDEKKLDEFLRCDYCNFFLMKEN